MNPVIHRPSAGTGSFYGEQRNAFLLRLSDALRPIADAQKIQSVACHLLGRQLDAGSVHYSTINEEQTQIKIIRHYVRDPQSDLIAHVPFSDFAWAESALREGEALIVSDVETSSIIPDSARSAVAALQIGSFISVPLVKEGRLVASLNVTDTGPRQWTTADLNITRETAERT